MKHKYNFFLLFFFIVLFLYVNKNTEEKEKLIKSDFGITYAKVTSFSYGRTFIGYSYKVDSIEYVKSVSSRFYTIEERQMIFNSKWPVIFYKKDPNLNYLLLRKRGFEYYGLTKPDSLPVFYDEY